MKRGSNNHGKYARVRREDGARRSLPSADRDTVRIHPDGGVLCDVADYAMGFAYASTLEEGETFTTLELKINFLKPVWNAHRRAVGRVVKKGRTIGLVECDVTDEKQSLVARASSTCMTLRGKEARGR